MTVLLTIFLPAFESFCADMGFKPSTCKVRRPQTKGKVERSVRYLKENFLPGRRFTDLYDLNRQALQWCQHVNGKKHGTTGKIPLQELTAEHLNPLPPQELRNRYRWEDRRISKDGFVLLAAEQDGDDYRLPYVNFNFDGADHWLQNAYVAFIFLQQYYFWDMPAPNFKINGIQYTAQGVKKLKTQTLDFPCLHDPEMFRLIKTNLGNGMIQKLSLNLSSRKANATLRYDTE